MEQNQSAYSYRKDALVPAFDDAGPVTVMDANCSLCAKGAAWIAHNDKAQEFHIIPIQTELGKALLEHFGMDKDDPSSWLFLLDGNAYTSLDALIRVGNRLGGIWRVFNLLRLLPTFIQNPLYRLVARNRIKWFGTADLCALPDPEVQKRLIT